MTDDAPVPEAPASPPVNPAGLARFWERYKRARGARLGLYLVVAFTLLAFFAPFLAHRLPIFWRQFEGADPVTGRHAPSSVSFPLIREFFAPSDTTEPVLERGINFLMLFLPLAFAAWTIMNRRFPRLGKTESRGIALLFGAMFAAALWFAIGGMVVDAGGKDWLYSESPPVPEVDDLENPGAYRAGRDGAARRVVQERLRELGAPDPAEELDAERLARALIVRLQEAIDGPPLAPPDSAAGAEAARPEFTAAVLDSGVDTARWNRVLVETAYPGLLVPMRQFRASFLGMAVVCVLALFGLTYIFMAGAWQFALSPRWLVLLVLAGLLALPFRLQARHNQTPYRRMAAEGRGSGIFPLIPYGPNENVFGPRLPPSWHVEPPLLTGENVRSWPRLVQAVSRPEAAEARGLIEQSLPEWRGLSENADGRERVVEALNGLLARSDLHAALVTPSLRGDPNIAPFLAVLRSGGELTPIQTLRLNRLLLERTFPGVLAPAAASHWKKPRDADGYHLLGTDESGRDVLVRIIHGARVSLSVGFVSVFLATVIGLVLGALAGYYGGKVDMLISRFMEIMMCFPSFFLILAVIAVLDRRSIVNIMLVIGLTSWTGVARLIRGEMLRQRKMDYVSASIALGASDTRTIFRHILPNAMAPILVSISFGITGAILTEAGLSFIGFGVTPPTPTWGQLLSETRDSPLANWWLAVFPGIVLFLSVLAYNMVGEAVRDALDPRAAR